MSDKPAGFLNRVLGRKSADETDAAPALASRLDTAPMDAGPILTLCFSYERGDNPREVTSADYALNMLLKGLSRLKIRATFQCPARLAETAFAQVTLIRDAGHEIACQGYRHETPADLTGAGLTATLKKCREVLGELEIAPAGFHPPAEISDAADFQRIAAEGFRYISELSREDGPRLLVDKPGPLVRMPIAGNDSGYARHPENPRHVVEKHAALIERLARKKHYLALNYHTWVLGESRERFSHLEELLKLALDHQVQFRPFVQALPAPYRPKPGGAAEARA